MSGPYRDEHALESLPARLRITRTDQPSPPSELLEAFDFSDGSLVVQRFVKKPWRREHADVGIFLAGASVMVLLAAWSWVAIPVIGTLAVGGSWFGRKMGLRLVEELDIGKHGIIQRRELDGVLELTATFPLSDVLSVEVEATAGTHMLGIETVRGRVELLAATEMHGTLPPESAWLRSRVRDALMRARADV